MKGFVEIGEAIYTDVTGGMLGKISEAVSAVEAGISVLLINALKPDVVRKALCGEPVIGTWLTG
jgi:isopentenyl phosphate kinase